MFLIDRGWLCHSRFSFVQIRQLTWVLASGHDFLGFNGLASSIMRVKDTRAEETAA